MLKFSANLGFLWQELALCDAVHAAAEAGFDAVEFHWPYAVPATDLASALQQHGLPMLGLNTRIGDKDAGEFGLSALPGRESQAREYIDEAIAYALEAGCRNIHVMAGKTDGSEIAEAVYRDNLLYACQQGLPHGLGVLIEPINQRDVPGYHLSSIEDAVDILQTLNQPNLKLMFDCYHSQIMQGDICRRLQQNLDVIGHVQIAAVPDRGEPDQGELDYRFILQHLDALGYQGYVGAEYKPRGNTVQGLGWLQAYR